MKLRIEPEAELDVDDAFRWYEGQVLGLGYEFIRAVDACLSLIQRNPEAYRKVYRQVRRANLRRFPYSVFYFSAG
jgi:plasmid stabilization system protein ParE